MSVVDENIAAAIKDVYQHPALHRALGRTGASITTTVGRIASAQLEIKSRHWQGSYLFEISSPTNLSELLTRLQREFGHSILEFTERRNTLLKFRIVL